LIVVGRSLAVGKCKIINHEGHEVSRRKPEHFTL
jgi:hypothetical protein